jgi:hypothetical protein
MFKEMHKTYSRSKQSTIPFTFCARVHSFCAKQKLSALCDKPKTRYKLTTEYNNFMKSYAQVKLAQYSY